MALQSSALSHQVRRPAPFKRVAAPNHVEAAYTLPGARQRLEDGQLVTLALNGDERAFPVLMARYAGRIRGVIAKRVSTPEDAADLVQETLTSAWSALQTYPVSRPFEIWLVCIAINKCRDWGRRRLVRHKAAHYLQDLGPCAELDAETRVIGGQTMAGLEAALADLPQSLRDPLIMTTLQGRSQRDAAAALGLTVKSVENRVRRARQELRELLARTPTAGDAPSWLQAYA